MILFRSHKALTQKVWAFLFLTVAFIVANGCQSTITSDGASVRRIQNAGQAVAPVAGDAKPFLPSYFTVSFVGDVILHERLRRREDVTKEGFNRVWDSIQPYINAADVSYANLEGPVAPDLGVTGFPRFNYPEKIISDLKNNGFDIVSTANNHSLDRYSKGVIKTIENLKKHNLAYTGTVTSADAAAQGLEKWYGLTPLPKTTSYIAWLACTEMTNGNEDKDELVLYCYKDREIVKAVLQQLREMPDIAGIILTPHWGDEEKFEIDRRRQTWAQEMLDNGALGVAGSHPHVVQRIEEYGTLDGRRTFIAYSLGNFISNQPWTPNKTSMMLLAKFSMNSIRQLQLNELKYVPLWMNRTSDKDGTSKFRLETVWDLSKKPSEATKIWRTQTGESMRLKGADQVDAFLRK